jgi:hypothetical protein
MKVEYWITDIRDGLLLHKVDLGNVSWSMTVNDASLTTQPDKKVGTNEVQQIDVPWSAIPGVTQHERYSAIEPFKKGVAVFLVSDEDERSGRKGTPFMWGGITNISSEWDSVTITVSSVYAMLKNRFAVREGDFEYPHSKNQLSYAKMTLRGIACEVIKVCTIEKPGGSLPVDLPYLGEQHNHLQNEDNLKHNRNYWAWNIANISGQQILDKLAGVRDGVDMQFRPYLTADNSHVRVMFVAGTDEEMYLPQTGRPYSFSCFDGGGTFEKLHVDYAQPIERWYATGAGQDAEVLTYLASDLSLVNMQNGFSLCENTISDSDASNPDILVGEANGKLNSWNTPIMQFSGEYDMSNGNTPTVGMIWPGELCYLNLSDYPNLPDKRYKCRIMEMSGNTSTRVKLTFDTQTVPWYNK